MAAYNPLTQALDLFPGPPGQVVCYNPQLPEEYFREFHIVVSEEDQGMFRMVCVQHRNTQRQLQACTTVFSSTTREWNVSPWLDTPTPLQPDGETVLYYDGIQSNGFIYWKEMSRAYAYVLVLNTATLQFSRLDLPSFLREVEYKGFSLGHTKDGKLCMVAMDGSDAHIGMLLVWFWTADKHGVEKWMLQDAYPLRTFLDATKSAMQDHVKLEIEGVIDGFVYTSVKYDVHIKSVKYDVHIKSLVSLCLETGKLNKLFDGTYAAFALPYIMPWPSSLTCNEVSNFLNIKVKFLQTSGPWILCC
jgi:hypothetical protein